MIANRADWLRDLRVQGVERCDQHHLAQREAVDIVNLQCQIAVPVLEVFDAQLVSPPL